MSKTIILALVLSARISFVMAIEQCINKEVDVEEYRKEMENIIKTNNVNCNNYERLCTATPRKMSDFVCQISFVAYVCNGLTDDKGIRETVRAITCLPGIELNGVIRNLKI